MFTGYGSECANGLGECDDHINMENLSHEKQNVRVIFLYVCIAGVLDVSTWKH